MKYKNWNEVSIPMVIIHLVALIFMIAVGIAAFKINGFRNMTLSFMIICLILSIFQVFVWWTMYVAE